MSTVLALLPSDDASELTSSSLERVSCSSVISLEGRMYPVEVAYLSEPSSDYVEAAVQAVFDIHAKACFIPFDASHRLELTFISLYLSILLFSGACRRYPRLSDWSRGDR